MEDTLYEELERVFAKISEYARRGDIVPIAELYFCYTVSDAFAPNETSPAFRSLTKRRATSSPFTYSAKAWI